VCPFDLTGSPGTAHTALRCGRGNVDRSHPESLVL